MRSLNQRFWSKVDKDGPEHPVLGTKCWLWQGATSAGYGKFRLNNKLESAHRVSWFIETGSWPVLNVLHKCDRTNCIRPDHLFEGDQKDNLVDAADKGRMAAGVRHYKAGLTPSEMREIQRGYKKGVVTMARIASAYGVSVGYVSLVVNRKVRRKDLSAIP